MSCLYLRANFTMPVSDIPSFLRKNALRILLVVMPLLSVAMHWRAFQVDLMGAHVWRQVQTQTVVNNFYREDFNILNPRLDPRGSGDGIERLEFPVMQWIFACFYKLLGPHIAISRVLSLLIGLGTLTGLYFLIHRLFKDRIPAIAGAWSLGFSPAFFYYTVNPLPDNFSLCCSVWGLAAFFDWYERRRTGTLMLTGIFLGLATLSKLPFVLYFSVPFLCFLTEWLKVKNTGQLVRHSAITAAFLLPPFAWYIRVIPSWDTEGVISGVIGSRLSGSMVLKYVLDNVTSIIPEYILNYAALPLLLAGIYYAFSGNARHDKRFVLLTMLFAALAGYFFYEINVIGNVHDYYLFPFVPLLFILVAYGAFKMLSGTSRQARFALFCLVLLPFTAFLRTRNSWNPESPGFNRDWLAYRDELKSAAPPEALCIAGNDASYQIIFYYVGKKGWPFTDNRLNAEHLRGMISEGAQYLYSDARQVDENPEIRPLLDSLVLERGSVRVYRLER